MGIAAGGIAVQDCFEMLDPLCILPSFERHQAELQMRGSESAVLGERGLIGVSSLIELAELLVTQTVLKRFFGSECFEGAEFARHCVAGIDRVWMRVGR